MSTRGTSTRKRARTGSVAAASNDGATPEPGNVGAASRKRDEEFWYEDGSIILVARDVEFRVFKGILAEHSPVFRDMFSLPQPQGDASSSTGTSRDVEHPCPIVHLSDSPEDLRHVLRAYMPKGGPSAFFHSGAAPPYSYHSISAAVRLGHKYQMTGILDNALEYLKTYYPTDFEKWTALDEYGPPGFGIHHAIGVVNLARLVDNVSLLLMALLVCCEFEDGEQLIRGFEREDGSREQLTLDDVGRCYSAQIRLAGESAKIALRACRPELSDACKTRQDCADTFEGMLNKLGDIEDPRSISHFDPSAATQAFLDIFEDDDLCARCQAVLHARVLRERKSSWAKLPEIFDLTLPQQVPREPGQPVV